MTDAATTQEVQKYSAISMLLHWVIAALILAQYLTAWYFEDLTDIQALVFYVNLHKSFGITILALAVLRLIWRHISPPPPLPDSLSATEQKLAHLGHLALYGVLFAMPLLGLIGSFMSGFPTIFFNLFNIPSPLANDKELSELLFELHDLLGIAILFIVGGHVLAALRHTFLHKINILGRMLPGKAKIKAKG